MRIANREWDKQRNTGGASKRHEALQEGSACTSRSRHVDDPGRTGRICGALGTLSLAFETLGIDLFVDTPCVTNERLSKCHGYSSALVVCGRSDESMDDRDSRRSEAACAVLERRGESAGCETVFAAPAS